MSDYFSSEIDKYLAAWILPDTWHKGHATDEQRFFMFVKALHHYDYANRFDEPALRDKLFAAVERNHKFNREAAQKIVANRVSEARTILDFLNATCKFPDPDIESWTPPLN